MSYDALRAVMSRFAAFNFSRSEDHNSHAERAIITLAAGEIITDQQHGIEIERKTL